MTNLTDLPNVGPVLAKNLQAAGINTPEKLRELGAKEAFLRIRMIDPEACLHMLYGVEGAIQGVQDKFLSPEAKQDLKEFFRAL